MQGKQEEDDLPLLAPDDLPELIDIDALRKPVHIPHWTFHVVKRLFKEEDGDFGGPDDPPSEGYVSISI